MSDFKLISKFKPTGDQPQAIKKLVKGLKKDYKDQTLLGVTGSGKTFTMANIITQVQKPTLIISHNKTLAAQLASEFQDFFPENAVHYFVSYYDYYQPEAYIPRSDIYIEKETEINEEIDRLRHAATSALLTRKDVLIVASVSCIYGLGSPADYLNLHLEINQGEKIKLDKLLKRLNDIQYSRNEIDFKRGTFRVRGDILEIFPIESMDNIVSVELFGDKVEKISMMNYLTRKSKKTVNKIKIFPAKHFVTPLERFNKSLKEITEEMKQQVNFLKKNNRLLEAQRIEQRTKYDLEMIEQTGYCTGIENYSRYLTNRRVGEPPATLLDYYPEDFLMFIDESHITIPQIGGMYYGDRSRKKTLIEYGFRLPSALDNRPLNFKEFESHLNQVIYVSATPAAYEYRKSKVKTFKTKFAGIEKEIVDQQDLIKKIAQKDSQVAQQVIRPTGLLDPEVEVKKTKYQIDDLLEEIKKRAKKKQRVLVTTLTKRLAEDLTEYLQELDIKVQYLHSEIQTLERLDILRDLRLGKYDVLIGINLLREGLDLPEVSLVAILDADKEGFLRSETSLIQVMGRAARHLQGKVIMYADKVTVSMKKAITETKRRRKVQSDYNKKHKITPRSIVKDIKEGELKGRELKKKEIISKDLISLPKDEINFLFKDWQKQMELAASNLEFEKAAELRDLIERVTKLKKIKSPRKVS
ncbi:excinuclease ABC subunit UvrB [Patescibacteria group bacterium]|nr:excinuclease ABC subunit UvrB [Patescibacteria group bacterium]